MSSQANQTSPLILFSCITERAWSGEGLVEEHTLCNLLSGNIEFFTEDGLRILQSGDSVLVKRNKLLKVRKFPENNKTPCKSVNITLSQELLHTYALESNISPQECTSNTAVEGLQAHPLLDGLFASIRSYEHCLHLLTPNLARLKVFESIGILMETHPNLKSPLFRFAPAHRIDLEQFMVKNFTFNVPLEQFAKRSGRSLSTFQRDFEKVFSTTPSRWLRTKRLEYAHYLIKERCETPSDAYLKSGFENLSHFSAAFKDYFGYNPSTLTVDGE
jgi:AraC-like DNA-binding protein